MSKFLELFQGKIVYIRFKLHETKTATAEGYLIDEDDMYYYIGRNNVLEITFLIKKDRVTSVITNHKS